MGINYTPSMKGYSGQSPFKFWCQTVLPTEYDDSMSYYELLNKVVTILNTAIKDVDNAEKNIDALLNAYNELQGYVNSYFDNLDVQEEINNKLDAMAQAGTLTDLLYVAFQREFVPAIDAWLDANTQTISQEIGANLEVMAENDELTPLLYDAFDSSFPGAVDNWLDENIQITGTSPALDATLTLANAAAQAKAVGDLCLHYKAVSSTNPHSSVANFTPNTFSYISTGSWDMGTGFPDRNVQGFLFTIKITSSSAYGTQIFIQNVPANWGSSDYIGIYFRKCSTSSNVETWSNWYNLVDTTLTYQGLAADAKAVGLSFTNINNAIAEINDDIYAINSELPYLIDVCEHAINFHRDPPSMPNDSLKRLQNFTTSFIDGRIPEDLTQNYWGDAPAQTTGLITTVIYEGSGYLYGLQLWISSVPASTDSGYGGVYIRRRSAGTWTDWYSLIDDTLTQSGVAADAKTVGDAIKPYFYSNGAYYAFGDSLVKAQIGFWNDPEDPQPTTYSTKGYANATAEILHLTLKNKAIGGQGLIKDWGKSGGIIDTIFSLDMSDAKLITVGWAGNDGVAWTLPSCDMGTYTDTTEDVIIDGSPIDFSSAESVKKLVVYDGQDNPTLVRTTVMGFYYTIMRILQSKCPTAQVILVTGYGSHGGNSSQHIKATLKKQFTNVTHYGSGVDHTTGERYNELEKMANLHGWCCVNQAKGCCFNEFNASQMFGDQAHPTDEGYALFA